MLTQNEPRRLYRSRTNVVFAGVAAGIAEYFHVDPTLVRVVLALILIAATGPFAPVVYAIMAAIIPQTPVAHHARIYTIPEV
ncbi:MAG TPA: PspC domain-containing protein [Herpetosiphonaceae bacterium]